MERLVAQRVHERVVVELDRLRGGAAAVDDAGRLAGAAHAARVGASFGGAGKRGELDRGHVGDSFCVSAAFRDRYRSSAMVENAGCRRRAAKNIGF